MGASDNLDTVFSAFDIASKPEPKPESKPEPEPEPEPKPNPLRSCEANPSGERPALFEDGDLEECLNCGKPCDPEKTPVTCSFCSVGPFCNAECKEENEASHHLVCSEGSILRQPGLGQISKFSSPRIRLCFFFSDRNEQLAAGSTLPVFDPRCLPEEAAPDLNVLSLVKLDKDGILKLPIDFPKTAGLRFTEINTAKTAKSRHYLRILHYGWLRNRSTTYCLYLNRELMRLWLPAYPWP
ncbi:uncharacterized protein E0L32_006022 [Thyridium curvatum]|uniref:MYND-type domain-containing protein n=1 Tax=Thyridium curvatum TaxID=1093900 RepID=A0A507B914_9PEZI|nr:uncharacterized protein E0L32_006022 [Thyridium curvatum]TPX13551.1 hypothetical protein E0L32_006022 [Thyridium curvatum]